MILCSDEINYRDRETRPVPKLVLRTEKICRYSPAATLLIITELPLVRQTTHQQQPSHRPAVTLWSSSSCPVWIWDLLLTTPTSILRKVTSPAQKSKQPRSSGGSRWAELRLDLCLGDSKPLRQLAGYFQKMQHFSSPQSGLGLTWSAPRAVSFFSSSDLKVHSELRLSL